MNTGFAFHADESNINLKVAIDLYAEHQRIHTLSLVRQEAGLAEEAALLQSQADCIYKALCSLAKYYGFEIERVMCEYSKMAAVYEMRAMEQNAQTEVPPESDGNP